MGSARVDYTELIQSLIDENDVHRYLEIGVDRGINFAAVRCDLKVGVDPSPSSAATHHMTSDEFFAANDREGGTSSSSTACTTPTR